MSTISVLRELARRRRLVVLALAVAALVSLLVAFRVSLVPPSLSERSDVRAEGSIQILVDSATSPIADARRDLTGLTARAGVFARLIAGGNIVGRIATETGIPARQIEVSGPLPLPGEAPGISEGPAVPRPYRIEVTQQPELPIISVATRAPRPAQARALAAAAPRAVGAEVAAIQAQQQTPEAKKVEFRELGPAQVAVVDDALGKKVAAAVFVVLSLLLLTAIVGLPRFLAAWRSAGEEPERAAAPGPVHGPPRPRRHEGPVAEPRRSGSTASAPAATASAPAATKPVKAKRAKPKKASKKPERREPERRESQRREPERREPEKSEVGGGS